MVVDSNLHTDHETEIVDTQLSHSSVKRIQSDDSSEKRRSVEDLTKYFEGKSDGEALKRPSSLTKEDSEQFSPEIISILETPGKEAYNEQQIIEIGIDKKLQHSPDEDNSQHKGTQMVKGVLDLTVVKARDLQKKDLFSKSDPYAI